MSLKIITEQMLKGDSLCSRFKSCVLVMLVISMMMVWRRLDNVEYSIQDRHSERDTGEDREIRSARSLPTTLDRVDNDKQQPILDVWSVARDENVVIPFGHSDSIQKRAVENEDASRTKKRSRRRRRRKSKKNPPRDVSDQRKDRDSKNKRRHKKGRNSSRSSSVENERQKKKRSRGVAIHLFSSVTTSAPGIKQLSRSREGNQREVEVNGEMVSALGVLQVGILTHWNVSDDHSTLTYDNTRGTVTVTRSGMYYIYAQVRFHLSLGKFCFSINVNGEPVFSCLKSKASWSGGTTISTNQAQYQSCYTGGVHYLEENDQVYIQDDCNQLHQAYYFLRSPNSTYWGMFLIK